MVEFIIIGDELKPYEATEKLKIAPTKYWVKGNNINGKNRKRVDTCWIIDTGYEESNDINDQLAKIIRLLNNKQKILKEFRKENNLEYHFSIVINIENNETPAIYFNKDFIELSYEIGAEFSIDLYVYS
jgi:hypothetical protein